MVHQRYIDKFQNYLQNVLLPLTILTLGTFIRVYFAPLSTGPDLIQFFSFAKSIRDYGFSFYIHSKGLPPFAWDYVYPPLWAIILLPLIMAYGCCKIPYTSYFRGDVYIVRVDKMWITLVKIPLICADLIIALMLYFMLKGRFRTLSLAAWMLAPMSIYISSIYGMFDALALIPLVPALYLIQKGKRIWLSSMLTALAIMIKQTMIFTIIPILPILIRINYKKFIEFTLSVALISFIIFSPFIFLSENPNVSLNSILSIISIASNTYYPLPLVYSLNGIYSLLTWVKINYKIETLPYFKYWFIHIGIMFMILFYISYKKRTNSIFTLALLGYLTFVITYWRVNHQYLTPLIVLMLISYKEINKAGMPAILASFLLYLIINFWVIMFPIAFWFHVYIPEPERNKLLLNALENFSLRVFSDIGYVTYSLILSICELILWIILCIQLIKEYHLIPQNN